jgi:hypothetical protein
MDNRVEIAKIDLREGEELMDFVDKVHKVVANLAQVPAPWDKKQKVSKYYLRGIFNGNVVVRERDTDKFFRMPLSRNDKGDITVGPAKEEVKRAFVPLSSNVAKSEGDPDDPRLVELPALTLVAKGDGLTEESISLLNEIVKEQEEGSPESTYVDIKAEEAPEAAKPGNLWDGVIP